MGLKVTFQFECDLCGEKVEDVYPVRRYEEIPSAWSPVTDDWSWFWLDNETIVCPKHRQQLDELKKKLGSNA